MSRCLRYIFVCVLTVVGLLVAVDDVTAQQAQQRAAIPGEVAQQASQKAASALYSGRFRQAKTTADKTALAAEMIDAALKVEDGSADQYVLLRIARDMAAGAGDAPTALRAVESTVERFDVVGAKLTAETLQAAGRNATTSGQQKAVAEAVVSVVDAVADADEYELALGLCDLALGFAKSSKQYPLAKELTTRIEGYKDRRRAFREYRDAWTVLDANPTEPAANLAAGRYECFVKGDWERGVAKLALGSDAALKDVAIKDLRGANSAEDQAAIGDGWWDLAETKQGTERDLLRLRAGFWYRQAESTIPAGLDRLKVTKRLGEMPSVASAARLPAKERTTDKSAPKALRRITRTGFPSIAGVWQESPGVVFVISQKDQTFEATTVYRLPREGEIRA